MYVLILTKNGLGYILGDFFFKNSSSHPVDWRSKTKKSRKKSGSSENCFSSGKKVSRQMDRGWRRVMKAAEEGLFVVASLEMI
jgi:hypothetical protein